MNRLLSTILLMITATLTWAQISFTSSISRVSDNELSLTFRAKIEDGYHLNTDLVFEEQDGVELKGDMKTIKEGVYEQRIAIKKSAYNFSGYLEYYACNDMQCLAPASVEFSYDGKLTAMTSDGSKVTVIDTVSKQVAASIMDTIKPREDVEITDLTAYDLIQRAASPLWTPIIEELNALSKQPLATHHSLFSVFLICFLGGLLTILTPCVWPIIPLTVSFFIKRGEKREALEQKKAEASKVIEPGDSISPDEENDTEHYSAFAINETWKEIVARNVRAYMRNPGVRDAALYGSSIVVMFMVLGIFMTLVFGVNAMNALSTNAVFNVICFFMLIIFGVSFLGFFEIRLPNTWGDKLNIATDSHNGLISMLFMSLTLVVVSFSCTAPVLGYLLVEIAVQGDILAPAIGMLAYSMAIALPFALFAIFPTILKKMPRSGFWMNHIKVTLGFLELAFSLKFLSVADMSYGWGILPRWAFLSLWIIIFLLLALYHTQWLHIRKAGWFRLSIACISLVFVIYLIPGLWGAKCDLVSAFAPPAESGPKVSNTIVTKSENSLPTHYSNYEEGMAAAAMMGKPVILDFTGYGCVNCRKMEATVWGSSRIHDIINKDYLVIMLYVDDKTPLPQPQKVTINGKERTIRSVGDMWSYLESYKFGAISQPFYVLLSPDGKPINSPYGYDEDVDKYLKYLQTGLERYKNI